MALHSPAYRWISNGAMVMHQARKNTQLACILDDGALLHRHYGCYEAAIFLLSKRVSPGLILRVLLPLSRRRPIPQTQRRS